MRLTAFFKLYKICILLHRCNLKKFAKNRFEISAIFVKIENSAKFKILQKSQKFAKFQKNQLDNLVDFEKCCKTHVFFQKSVPIQPKASEFLPKFSKNWQLPYWSAGPTPGEVGRRGGAGPRLEVRALHSGQSPPALRFLLLMIRFPENKHPF